ncbi:hypothetical protein HRbin06_00331 [archaeon HR06]|nr:hypothetical protein HRbin06_00331 [archaeon HR06]
MIAKKECPLCKKNTHISKIVGVCVSCLRNKPDEALAIVEASHRRAREEFNLPPEPPRDYNGVKCNLCAAECILGKNSLGYCGIRGFKDGKYFSYSSTEKGLLHYYLDPHVTNCCNAWFCPAGTGSGYPKYSYCKGAELGYYNLALFFYGCSFNCLFCQNWCHKIIEQGKVVSVDELVKLTLKDYRISCWCWFGGSAEPQLPFAIKASKSILEAKPPRRIVRICYEWNGDGNPILVKRACETVLESGGNVKFDLKAFNPIIHKALTGMDNERTLKNFEMVYREFYDKREIPVLGATTLLVPYYVDSEEVKSIAEFIASLNDGIPYSLLIFHPDFLMKDLPITPEKQVRECY